MQTAKIIPIQRTKPSMQLAFSNKQEAEEWIYPGKIIDIAPGIRMGIAYDQTDGEYHPLFKFYHNQTRIRDIELDDRHQIDLRTSCRKIITVIATKHDKNNGRPMKTLLVVEHVPYSWEQ